MHSPRFIGSEIDYLKHGNRSFKVDSKDFIMRKFLYIAALAQFFISTFLFLSGNYNHVFLNKSLDNLVFVAITILLDTIEPAFICNIPSYVYGNVFLIIGLGTSAFVSIALFYTIRKKGEFHLAQE